MKKLNKGSTRHQVRICSRKKLSYPHRKPKTIYRPHDFPRNTYTKGGMSPKNTSQYLVDNYSTQISPFTVTDNYFEEIQIGSMWSWNLGIDFPLEEKEGSEDEYQNEVVTELSTQIEYEW